MLYFSSSFSYLKLLISLTFFFNTTRIFPFIKFCSHISLWEFQKLINTHWRNKDKVEKRKKKSTVVSWVFSYIKYCDLNTLVVLPLDHSLLGCKLLLDRRYEWSQICLSLPTSSRYVELAMFRLVIPLLRFVWFSNLGWCGFICRRILSRATSDGATAVRRPTAKTTTGFLGGMVCQKASSFCW